MSARRPTSLLVGCLLLTSLLAACGDTKKESSATTTTAAPVAGVTARGAWARTSPASATTGVVYVTLASAIDDALTGATVAPAVAAKSELHETVAAGAGSATTAMGGATTTEAMGGATTTEAMGGATTTVAGSGEMTMRPVDKIELKAGKPVTLEPGGYHIMLMDLVAPLKAGATVEVTFQFSHAKPLTINVPVRDDAP
jgi:copper(I)-binding protein